MVGSFLGGNTRVDGLHHLLEDAFVETPAASGSPMRSWNRSARWFRGQPTRSTR